MPLKKVPVQPNEIKGAQESALGVSSLNPEVCKTAPEAAPKPASVKAAAWPKPVFKKPKTRANYNFPGPAKGKMDAAVLERAECATPADIATGKELSENKFAAYKCLTQSTFHKDVVAFKAIWTALSSVPERAATAKFPAKRRRRGKPPLISYGKQVFVV